MSKPPATIDPQPTQPLEGEIDFCICGSLLIDTHTMECWQARYHGELPGGEYKLRFGRNDSTIAGRRANILIIDDILTEVGMKFGTAKKPVRAGQVVIPDDVDST